MVLWFPPTRSSVEKLSYQRNTSSPSLCHLSMRWRCVKKRRRGRKIFNSSNNSRQLHIRNCSQIKCICFDVLDTGILTFLEIHSSRTHRLPLFPTCRQILHPPNPRLRMRAVQWPRHPWISHLSKIEMKKMRIFQLQWFLFHRASQSHQTFTSLECPPTNFVDGVDIYWRRWHEWRREEKNEIATVLLPPLSNWRQPWQPPT